MLIRERYRIERFTKHTPENFGYFEYELKQDIDEMDVISRLGAYEDTELTPEEITLYIKCQAQRISEKELALRIENGRLHQEIDKLVEELEIAYGLADNMYSAIFNKEGMDAAADEYNSCFMPNDNFSANTGVCARHNRCYYFNKCEVDRFITDFCSDNNRK